MKHTQSRQKTPRSRSGSYIPVSRVYPTQLRQTHSFSRLYLKMSQSDLTSVRRTVRLWSGDSFRSNQQCVDLTQFRVCLQSAAPLIRWGTGIDECKTVAILCHRRVRGSAHLSSFLFLKTVKDNRSWSSFRLVSWLNGLVYWGSVRRCSTQPRSSQLRTLSQP